MSGPKKAFGGHSSFEIAGKEHIWPCGQGIAFVITYGLHGPRRLPLFSALANHH
jgi:hypothetical protein